MITFVILTRTHSASNRLQKHASRSRHRNYKDCAFPSHGPVFIKIERNLDTYSRPCIKMVFHVHPVLTEHTVLVVYLNTGSCISLLVLD